MLNNFDATLSHPQKIHNKSSKSENAMNERESEFIFVWKDATKKNKQCNFRTKKKQCRQSCERLRNDHSPNPREIGTVVESAASHSFLNV